MATFQSNTITFQQTRAVLIPKKIKYGHLPIKQGHFPRSTNRHLVSRAACGAAGCGWFHEPGAEWRRLMDAAFDASCEGGLVRSICVDVR